MAKLYVGEWAARRDLAKKELAKLSGVSHGTISNLCNRTGKPNASTIQRVASALGLTPAELYEAPQKDAFDEPAAPPPARSLEAATNGNGNGMRPVDEAAVIEYLESEIRKLEARVQKLSALRDTLFQR